MSKGILPDRIHYCRSGRIGWTFFALAIPATVGAAVLLAAVLSLAEQVGLYFAAYAACLAAIPLCGVGWWGVRVGKCRNEFVAGLFGVLAGVTMYLAHFYVDLLAASGFRELMPPRALIRYIEFQLHHVRWQKPMEQDPPEPITGVNAVVFAAELFLVGVISAIGPVRMSRTVFCEKANTWATCRYFAIRPDSGILLFVAVSHGDWETCPIRFEPVAVIRGDRFYEVTIETCPASETCADAGGYLSIRQIDIAGRWRYQHRCDAGYLVRQCQLSAQEFEELQRRLGGAEKTDANA